MVGLRPLKPAMMVRIHLPQLEIGDIILRTSRLGGTNDGSNPSPPEIKK